MRTIRCRTCGERWSGRRKRGRGERGESASDFYFWHTAKHGLTKPTRSPDSYPVESIETYMERLQAFRREHFEDSNLEPLREQRSNLGGI